MIMGLKKILLAGTAMVAVSVLHAGVAQAYVIDNDFTGPNSGTVIASGESITSNADAKHANLNLNNADLIVGGVATGVTITNNNNTLYLYDTGANTTPNTLTLTGPANAIDVAAGQTFNIALGNYSGGDANPSQNTILLVNRNVVIGAGAAINISASTTKKSGHVVEFA
ncbi:MAG: hypothetical protein KJ667_01040, partial [Alphaproteobacteria bacterium]|nr:hypothetical protein [Alphaproteobacteria bacterium]